MPHASGRELCEVRAVQSQQFPSRNITVRRTADKRLRAGRRRLRLSGRAAAAFFSKREARACRVARSEC